MAEDEKQPADAAAKPLSELAKSFVTVPADKTRTVSDPVSRRLTWEAAGERMDYEATVAHLDVRDDTGALEGRMFSITYAKLGEDGLPMAGRPVTFCFNGGPGCASVPINFGGMGPRRVATDGVNHLPSSAKVEDNPYTLLRESDLVFLDALGTGYSPLAEGADTSAIFGVDGDADAFCRAITEWLEQNHRWQSP
ncbi:MAG: peptidase S10, partial [Olsenella sp.]|nr:peptidase S10 [Olsenella sp.]